MILLDSLGSRKFTSLSSSFYALLLFPNHDQYKCTLYLQNLLMDVRDKILFEPEYAGNIKEKVPPRPSIRIPWAWLPGALCLLQEVNTFFKNTSFGKFNLIYS